MVGLFRQIARDACLSCRSCLNDSLDPLRTALTIEAEPPASRRLPEDSPRTP